MTLTSLLVCPDKAATLLLKGVLEDLKLNVEVCDNLERAALRLSQERFDALILDCESLSEVRTLLTDTEAARQENATLTVAILQNQDNLRELFSLGANFVIYKPVTRERAVNSLRAARALMRKERRGSKRASLHAHASIDYASAEQQKATLVDLGEDGLAMHFGKKLPPSGKVYFQFQLPGQNSKVRLSGQVMWQDWNGRAGIQFKDVPQASRRLLREWLQLTGAKDPAAVSVTSLEVQTRIAPEAEPLQENLSSESERYAARPKAESAPVADNTISDPGDRRGLPRYTCRLGAEVYLKGSSVRNFCNLSDVGPGGCYLEMPMAFAAGSFVEITLRADDLKVHVSGQVQSSHPGYGMGISFRLESKTDRERVQQLIDIVAAAEKAQS
jgi:CheY-like chemotaxis protein